MQTEVQLSSKQIEYIQNARSRWNFKIGATQCGKTFIDVQFIIPNRIIERKGKNGLCVILGVTKETIERNVLEPMRDIWGSRLISSINSRNFATLFGEKVYCLGAEKLSQVSKLRGAKFKYAYIDEVVDTNEEVFQLLKSRLSLPYSVCDASGNPSYPSHFVKKFIDSAGQGVDVYAQQWTLYDNPFLSRVYIKSLEAEYAGTVFYDRYILGKWMKAEGLVYPMYDNTVPTEPRDYTQYYISMDFGARNPTAMVLWGLCEETWYAVNEYYHSGRDTNVQKTVKEYHDALERLAENRPIKNVIIDPSAAPFIDEMNKWKKFKPWRANNDVVDGIQHTASVISDRKILINDCCKNTIEEFGLYSWDDKAIEDAPIKENDHAMDAIRYFVNTVGIWRKRSEYRPIMMR